jgi:uncharacterized protein
VQVVLDGASADEQLSGDLPVGVSLRDEARDLLARPSAFLDNLSTMFTRWENEAFTVTTMFASSDNVAVFGDFRYRSHSSARSSPHRSRSSSRSSTEQVIYLQFLEDSYATAASFRQSGSWTVQTEPGAQPFEV